MQDLRCIHVCVCRYVKYAHTACLIDRTMGKTWQLRSPTSQMTAFPPKRSRPTSYSCPSYPDLPPQPPPVPYRTVSYLEARRPAHALDVLVEGIPEPELLERLGKVDLFDRLVEALAQPQQLFRRMHTNIRTECWLVFMPMLTREGGDP